MLKEALFPNEIIVKSKNFTISQDCEVPIPGFFILSSNREINSMAELNEEESKEMVKLMIDVRKGMQEALKVDKVYIFQNEDSEHGFHIWIFPRYEWMGRFGKKIESVRPIMEYAKKELKNNREVMLSVLKMRNYMRYFFTN